MGISSRVSTDQFPETMPAPLLLFVVLGLLALFSFVGDFAQLALDELRLGRHPVRHGDEERLHLLPVAVDLLLLALGEMDPPRFDPRVEPVVGVFRRERGNGDVRVAREDDE